MGESNLVGGTGAAFDFPMAEKLTDFREQGRFETEESLKGLLLEAVAHKISDVFIQPGVPALGEIDDTLHAFTRKRLDNAEVESMAAWVTGSPDAVAQLAQARPRDSSYEVFDPVNVDELGEKQRYRFRVNCTANDYRGGMGIQIVMRYIVSDPPSVEYLNLAPEIIEAMTPRDGIVYVTGKTGSGKTTTFAGMMRYLAENETPIRGNVVTGEAPIEYKFDKLKKGRCIFIQSEIPRHFQGFADFVKADMRRRPGLIMVGEARDQETIEAAIEASNTGHPVWTTVHSKSVGGTFRRLVSRIDKTQQSAILFDIITTAQMVVSQTLVPRLGGGRYPLREYLVITDSLRNQFYDVKDPDRISGVVQEAVVKYGRTMESVAREAFQKKIIPESAYELIKHSSGE
jgi:defect-in-organelle-trafficking protein DotB